MFWSSNLPELYTQLHKQGVTQLEITNGAFQATNQQDPRLTYHVSAAPQPPGNQPVWLVQAHQHKHHHPINAATGAPKYYPLEEQETFPKPLPVLDTRPQTSPSYRSSLATHHTP